MNTMPWSNLNRNMSSAQRSKLKKNLIAYSFILPNFLGFAIFTLIPMGFSLGFAFMNWDGAAAISWAGLDNFARMLNDQTFRIALLNTFNYVIWTVPLTMAAALGLALLLNQPLRGRNFFRTVFFFPYVASLVAVAVVWNMIFHPAMGPINMVL